MPYFLFGWLVLTIALAVAPSDIRKAIILVIFVAGALLGWAWATDGWEAKPNSISGKLSVVAFSLFAGVLFTGIAIAPFSCVKKIETPSGGRNDMLLPGRW